MKGRDPCPCDSGRPLRTCCRPLHRGRPAPTPERLMRSRYTAYALGKVAYVISTTHPDSPHARDDRQAWADELRAYCDAVRFTGLEVLSHGTDDEGGHVHFRAHLLGPGGPSVQEERSRFAKVDGRWAYLNGT